MPPSSRRASAALLATGIVFVALNLRPAIAGFGPLLAQMQHELGASTGTIGLLTTIPVLCFGLIAPLAARLARRWSLEAILLACLLIEALGAGLRAGPNLPTILLGTTLLGAAIAVMNVLLPGLVKRDFPQQTGLMMGVYTAALCTGASLASGLAIPLRDAFGGAWRPALAVWSAWALLGALVWLPALRGPRQRAAAPSGGHGPWRDPIAWQVTLYMGLQSLVFFAWLTWLPKLFVDRGLTPGAAGSLVALANVIQIPVTLAVPWLAGRLKDQRGLAAGTALLTAAGLVGLWAAPTAAPWLWALLLGSGAGAAIALALIVLRSRDVAQVPRLSAMAQCVGYLLAAGGPLLFGLLHDWTHGWHASIGLLIACSIGMLVTGWGAGRARHVASEGS